MPHKNNKTKIRSLHKKIKKLHHEIVEEEKENKTLVEHNAELENELKVEEDLVNTVNDLSQKIVQEDKNKIETLVGDIELLEKENCNLKHTSLEQEEIFNTIISSANHTIETENKKIEELQDQKNVLEIILEDQTKQFDNVISLTEKQIEQEAIVICDLKRELNTLKTELNEKTLLFNDLANYTKIEIEKLVNKLSIQKMVMQKELKDKEEIISFGKRKIEKLKKQIKKLTIKNKKLNCENEKYKKSLVIQ